ncbi:MAG: hypothetical protein RIR77_1042 [Planctomycetota bacterium]
MVADATNRANKERSACVVGYTHPSVQRNLRFLLALVTVTLVAAGGVGLRALHLTVESSAGHNRAACASHTDHGDHAHHANDGDHDDHAAAPEQHDESTCATCELLLTLATTTGADAPVPAFHALVAVASWPAPAVSAAPLPIPALAARPPPTC